MEAVVFDVLTKAGLLLALIVAFLAWNAAGQPFFTITRR